MSAGVKWGIAIVGLLVANLVAMGILLGAASADRPQVIPEYYDRAVHYDETIDQAATNRALGWTVRVSWTAALELVVRDRSGEPLSGARVQVVGTGRATSARRFDERLRESAPGTYAWPGGDRRGIYDLAIVIELGQETFIDRFVAEAK